MALLLRPLCALAALLAVALLAAPGNANTAQECCFQVMSRPLLSSRLVTSYRILGPQMGCQQEAVVFITKKGREVCISPDADWVAELMRKIDARNQMAEANRRGV